MHHQIPESSPSGIRTLQSFSTDLLHLLNCVRSSLSGFFSALYLIESLGCAQWTLPVLLFFTFFKCVNAHETYRDSLRRTYGPPPSEEDLHETADAKLQAFQLWKRSLGDEPAPVSNRSREAYLHYFFRMSRLQPSLSLHALQNEKRALETQIEQHKKSLGRKFNPQVSPPPAPTLLNEVHPLLDQDSYRMLCLQDQLYFLKQWIRIKKAEVPATVAHRYEYWGRHIFAPTFVWGTHLTLAFSAILTADGVLSYFHATPLVLNLACIAAGAIAILYSRAYNTLDYQRAFAAIGRAFDREGVWTSMKEKLWSKRIFVIFAAAAMAFINGSLFGFVAIENYIDDLMIQILSKTPWAHWALHPGLPHVCFALTFGLCFLSWVGYSVQNAYKIHRELKHGFEQKLTEAEQGPWFKSLYFTAGITTVISGVGTTWYSCQLKFGPWLALALTFLGAIGNFVTYARSHLASLLDVRSSSEVQA